MNAIESWESEGGALPRHLPVVTAAGSGALAAIRDASDQQAQEPVVPWSAISLTYSATTMMASRCPKFRNDRAVPEIRIGVREFNCIGASPPHDHPHVYINMGGEDAILCPYCATRYRYDPRLTPFEVDPPDSLFVDRDRV